MAEQYVVVLAFTSSLLLNSSNSFNVSMSETMSVKPMSLQSYGPEIENVYA